MIAAVFLLAQVTMNLASPQQTMDGFGCSMVELLYPGDATFDQLFSRSQGIGLNLLRLGIASSDMGDGYPPSRARDAWPGSQSCLVNAKEFQKRQPAGKILLTAWSADAACKVGGSLNTGSFNTSCNSSWSTWVGQTVADYQNSGVCPYAVSLQNEPDNDTGGAFPCMTFTPTTLTSWSKVQGPVLAATANAGCTAPLQAGPDTAQWSNFTSYVNALTADGTALATMGLWTTHQYGTPNGSVSAPPTLTGRNIWMDEASANPVAAQDLTLADGIAKAIFIHNALTTGQASAWIAWRCVNGQNDALIDGDASGAGGTRTYRYWMLGNYSNFVVPGMVRFPLTGTPPTNVSITSFKHPTTNNIAIPTINNQASTQALTVTLDSTSKVQAVTPWLTDATHNLVAQTPVVLTAGKAFTFTLPANSMVTFAGNGT